MQRVWLPGRCAVNKASPACSPASRCCTCTQANPLVICQRCNAPFAYLVDSQTLLHLVKSEDDLDDGFSASGQGDGEDDEDDDGEEGQGFAPDQPEKVGSHHFDLLAQIEDELILSVPYVPKHDVCPRAGQ